MMGDVRRRIRCWMGRGRSGTGRRGEGDARIPEEPQPGGPERPEEAYRVRPPPPEGERTHDGWSAIRPRQPGEDTDMGRDVVPDVTYPGRDLRPPPEDDERP
jgi:hypothetical protein